MFHYDQTPKCSKLLQFDRRQMTKTYAIANSAKLGEEMRTFASFSLCVANQDVHDILVSWLVNNETTSDFVS